MTIVWLLKIILLDITNVAALTGHVCSRQVAETYMTTYDRAFICPERYTTACGQLDWRRCTKYRVNTCYTPTEKYAVRYRTEEGCCPGWRDSGDGVCAQPHCGEGCQNGGTCADVGGMPGCLCSDGFHGQRCELSPSNVKINVASSSVDAWRVVMLSVAAVTALSVLAIIAVQIRKHRKRSSSQRRAVEESEKLLQADTADIDGDVVADTARTSAALRDTTRPLPSAPLRNYT